MTRMRATILAGAMGAALAGTAVAPAVAATPTSRQNALQTAQQMLSSAEKNLAEAKTVAADVRVQARNGTISQATIDNLATDPTEDFGSGTSDIDLIAGLMDSDPDRVLATASLDEMAEVQTVSAETIVPAAPVIITTPKQAVKAADDRVVQAQEDQAAAKALIKQLSGNVRPDGPGAAKLAKLCADAGVVVDVCQPVPWSEGHLQFDTVIIGRTVNVKWADVKEVGGWRPSDPYPDHPSGRAADIMMPKGGSGTDVALGNEIAKYFQQHAKEYGIEYMIWRQRQWTTGSPINQWNAMSDRGSPTANHMDHVHITVKDGHSGTMFKQLVKEAKKAARA